MVQPLTASQCAGRTELTLDCCKSALRQLAQRRLAGCLNEPARSGRVYGLTRVGVHCQRQVRRALQRPDIPYEQPSADWTLYGWLCFRHRAAVLRGLGEPGSASLIRRRAREHAPGLRISANNVRDVLRHFLARGIARLERTEGRRRTYSLTSNGQLLRTLLIRAEEVYR